MTDVPDDFDTVRAVRIAQSRRARLATLDRSLGANLSRIARDGFTADYERQA